MSAHWLASLSASLLVLALGLLALVWGINFYQARQAGLPLQIPRLWPRREQPVDDQEALDDAADADHGREDDSYAVGAEDSIDQTETSDGSEPQSPAESAAADSADHLPPPEPLDPRYELILQFSGEAPLAAVVGRTAQSFTRVQTKSVRAYLDLQKGVVQIGMTLATRSGFASLMEIESFLEQAERTLTPYGLKRLGTRPDPAAVMAQAREVDALLTSLDGQICFHIKASRLPAWSDVDRVMQDLGLVVRGDGHYLRQSSDGRPWYTIMPADQGLFLSFLLDLPHVATPAAVLGRMVAEAQSLAQAFEAELVDDRGMPLSAPAIAMMQSQVIARADQLQAAGLVPGALLTCRLFS